MKSTKIAMLLFAVNFGLSSLIAQNDTVGYFDEEAPLYFPKLFAEDTFPGSVYTISYSPNGKEITYSGNYDAYTIKQRSLNNSTWTEEVEPEFCIAGSDVQDASPCYSPDGNRIYFCSNREGGFGDYDLWYVEKTGESWSAPINAGENINSPGREDYPFIAEDGSLYFTSGREGANGFTDVFYAEQVDGEFQPAIQLPDTVNTAGPDDNPVVIDDRLFTGNPGRKQMLISTKLADNNWSVPTEISGGMFGTGYFLGYRLSPDKKYFMYTKDSKGGGNDFKSYWVDAEVLNYLGVKEAPFNYVAGWYTANDEQMAVALHPELAKRQALSPYKVSSVSYSWMLSGTKACYGCIDSVKKGRKDLTILDQTETTATIKAMSEEYYDFLHLVKFDGYWKVLNALWDYHTSTAEGDDASLPALLDAYVAGVTPETEDEYSALFHQEYKGRYALSHKEVHSLSKKQFLALQTRCNNCSMHSGFTYEILDRHKDIASVKVSKGDSVEYLHLWYQTDTWYIVNAVRNFKFDPERVYNLDIPILLSGKSITEGDPAGTELGEISLKLPQGPKVKFYLHENAGQESNNEWFTIEGTKLKSNHTFTAQDPASLSVSVIGVINKKDTITKTFKINLTHTSTTKIDEKKSILTFPNPNNGKFTVSLQNTKNVTGITVSDIHGNTVINKTSQFCDNETFDISHLPKGQYVVSIYGTNGTIQETIVFE